MLIQFIKSILLVSTIVFCSGGFARDAATLVLDSRYIGVWNGTWLGGMSSGKAVLNLSESGGHFSFAALPSFGTDPAPINKIKSTEKQLEFQIAGADGRAMRVELKPTSDYSKLKGKVFYEGMHMEVELSRAQ